MNEFKPCFLYPILLYFQTKQRQALVAPQRDRSTVTHRLPLRLPQFPPTFALGKLIDYYTHQGM